MKKKTARELEGADDMRPEYDFSGGVRGEYAKRFAESEVTVVALDSGAEEAPQPKQKP